MSARLEAMLEKVLENQNRQGIQLAKLETTTEEICVRGCTVGENNVDALEKSTKESLEAVRLENKEDTKDLHKRVDKFKIAALVLIVIGTILGLKGYPHAELW